MKSVLEFQGSIARNRRKRRDCRARVADVERLEPRALLAGGTGGLVASANQGLSTRFASLAEFDQYLIDATVAEWKGTLGALYPNWYPIPYGTVTSLGSVTGLADSTGSRTGTNVQVAGVDEGDIIENDGRFLYILSGPGLRIVDARNPGSLSIASTTAIDGSPIAEYLNGNRLTVISSLNFYLYSYPSITPFVGPIRPLGFGTISFSAANVGASTDLVQIQPGSFRAAPAIPIPLYQNNSQVKVTEFDVSNPAAPRLVHASTMDGTYVDSRAVGDHLYVILQNNLNMLPAPEFHVVNNEGVYETEAQYRARLETAVQTLKLPQVSSLIDVGRPGAHLTSSPLAPFDSIYKPAGSGDQLPLTLLSVEVFDAHKAAPGPAGSASVLASDASTVYATQHNMYLLIPTYPRIGIYTAGEMTTQIEKMALDGDRVALAAAGSVPGHVLNQFSVDEQGPYLRIATTETTPSVVSPGTIVRPATTNSLYVLRQEQSSLVTVGSLTNLAPGEQLFAARFFGNRAYLETFRQFDPLFAVDLSNPTKPRLAGELQIPGYSRYLQPIDATHLIGIGQLVSHNEPGQIQVSLFDVSDLAHPKRVDVYTISYGNGFQMSTGAEYDHHQVTYLPQKHILAIPVNGYATGASDSSLWRFRSALWVFKVDPAKGFTALGQVPDDSTVERSTAIGKVLFSLSQGDVKASTIATPLVMIGQVQLNAEDPSQGSITALSAQATVGLSGHPTGPNTATIIRRGHGSSPHTKPLGAGRKLT